jgi:predicted unusual protein kinase regulating ubiquinone biosynthesis (AarF/ABC1/UbiB family)
MPATVGRRVLEGDLSAAYGPAWCQRLIDFDETPAATASIGQVHRAMVRSFAFWLANQDHRCPTLRHRVEPTGGNRSEQVA